MNTLQKGGLADFNRVVMVGPNANYTTIASGITAAGLLTPTALNPVCIYLLPGHYLNEPSLVLPNYVSLVGMGPELCLIEWDGGVNPTQIVLRYSGINKIEGVSLKRSLDGGSNVNTLIRSIGIVAVDLMIKNCIGYGPGPGVGADCVGEFFLGSSLHGSTINVIDCKIINPGDNHPGAANGAISLLNCRDTKVVIKNTSIVSESATLTNGVDVGGTIDDTEIAIRDCTLITGDGISWHSVGGTTVTTHPVWVSHTSMKYATDPAFTNITEFDNLIDVNLTI
ncbi:MAG: hypothetical protein GY928_34080 [Colwellia sp.]|nr:hypothetical protein [Colwellia sp.]